MSTVQIPRIAAGDFDFIEYMLPETARHMFDSSVDYEQMLKRVVESHTPGLDANAKDEAFSEVTDRLVDSDWAGAYGRNVALKEASGESPILLAAYLGTIARNAVSNWKRKFSIGQEIRGREVSLSREAPGGEGSRMEGLIEDERNLAPDELGEQSASIEALKNHLAQNVRGWEDANGEPGLAQDIFDQLKMGQVYETDTQRIGPTAIVNALNAARSEDDQITVRQVTPILNEIRQQVAVYLGGDPTEVDQPQLPTEEEVFEAPVSREDVEPMIEAPVSQEDLDAPGPDDVELSEGSIYDKSDVSLWEPNDRGRYFTPDGVYPGRYNDIALAWFEPNLVPENEIQPEDKTPRWVHMQNSRRNRAGGGRARVYDLDEQGNVVEPEGGGFVVPLSSLDLNQQARAYRSWRRSREDERRRQQEMMGE